MPCFREMDEVLTFTLCQRPVVFQMEDLENLTVLFMINADRWIEVASALMPHCVVIKRVAHKSEAVELPVILCP